MTGNAPPVLRLQTERQGQHLKGQESKTSEKVCSHIFDRAQKISFSYYIVRGFSYPASKRFLKLVQNLYQHTFTYSTVHFSD